MRVYQPLFFGIFDDCLFSPVLSHLVTYSAKPPYPLPSLQDLDILLYPYPISSTQSKLDSQRSPRPTCHSANLSAPKVYFLLISLYVHLCPASIPMSPMTPGTISSLLSSIGRGGMRCIALLRLHPCASNASDVEERENVIPTMIPITMSRVKRVGSFNRCQTLEKRSVQAIFHPTLYAMISNVTEKV